MQRESVSELERPGRWLVVVAVLSLLWRLPSLFDPPWVNDEGTYFAIAQAMAHGYRLYAGVWENKPPLLYLVYAAVYHLFGPSLLAMRLLAAILTVGLVLLTYRLAILWVDRCQAAAAAFLTGLLCGVPFLEGTTANAEIFLAFFAAAGMAFGLRHHALPAGLCLGLAALFKVVAGFDALALALWLLAYRRREFPAYLAGAVLPLALTLLLAAHFHLLAAMLRDAFLYDLGYVGRGNGTPWLLAVKVLALLAITVWLWRRPFPYLWLVYALAGALVSGRVFGHYFLEVVVPLVLSLALATRAHRRPLRRSLVGLAAAFVLGAAVSAAAGWVLAATGHDSIFVRRLQYYANFVRYATGSESYAAYRSQVDRHVTRNIEVARQLTRLPPGHLLVWGNVPWVYVLSGRLPATAYTSALRVPAVPGETATLRASLAAGVPEEVVVIEPPLPPLGSARRSLRRRYRAAARIGNALIYTRRR